LGDRRLRLGLHRQPFVGLPAPSCGVLQARLAVLGRPSRSDGASALPRLPTLPGTGPSRRLRCAPCAVLLRVRLSRAPCRTLCLGVLGASAYLRDGTL